MRGGGGIACEATGYRDVVFRVAGGADRASDVAFVLALTSVRRAPVTAPLPALPKRPVSSSRRRHERRRRRFWTTVLLVAAAWLVSRDLVDSLQVVLAAQWVAFWLWWIIAVVASRDALREEEALATPDVGDGSFVLGGEDAPLAISGRSGTCS